MLLLIRNLSYPEILVMYVDNLGSALAKDGSGEVRSHLDERLRAFAKGEIDHASEAIASLWRALIQRSKSPTISSNVVCFSSLWNCPTSIYRQGPTPPTEQPTLKLKTALIKSVRQGTFCDRRYLAKRGNRGKRQALVYFSSIVLGDSEFALNTRKHPPHHIKLFLVLLECLK